MGAARAGGVAVAERALSDLTASFGCSPTTPVLTSFY